METYRTEEEQVEALKRWWEKNGKVVIVAGILFVAGVVGGRVWLDFKDANLGKASAEYDMMMEEMLSGETDSALRRGGVLMEQFSDSAYAAMAALAMAKMEADKGDYSSARLRLSWILENSPIAELEHVARTRLIRVLIAEGKLDEALTHANVANAGAFSAEYDMLRGDIFREQGKTEQARTAYNAALNAEGLSPQTKNFVRLKLDALGEAAQ